jgi:ornithine decarboxylase
MNLLDIGGGFPGAGSDTSGMPSVTGEPSPTSFVDIASTIRTSLAALFPDNSGVRVIAEPGRYFVEGAFVLCTSVISRRVSPATPAKDDMSGGAMDFAGVRPFTTSLSTPAAPEHTRYYINDGVYGSFNCVVYDHAIVRPTPLTSTVLSADLPTFRDYMARSVPVNVAAAGPGSHTPDVPCAVGEHPSSVWGQTCDGFDVVLPKVNLPALNIGDWLCFENMGAYTVAAGSTFNGFPKPGIEYLYDEGTAATEILQ